MATKKKGMLEKAKDAIVGVFTSDPHARKSAKPTAAPAKKTPVKKAVAKKATAKKTSKKRSR